MTEGSTPEEGGGDAPRYCGACGAVFSDRDGDRCPRCGAGWAPRSLSSVPAVAALLTELRWLREDGLLDAPSYASVRALYESRLAGLSTPPSQVGAGVTASKPDPEAAAARHRPSGLLRRMLDPEGAGSAAIEEPPAALPPAPPRPSLGEWAAARQADILLYLGAFVLSIAALIFVGYQGQALTGGARVVVLLLYTLTFLTLGLVLPRWDRVREAGPVFLALGALLVPVNVIALRTQVLGGGTLPDDALWLLGGAVTAALYLALAARGHGRLYALPGAAAGLVAWGALRAVIGIPDEWVGAWFVGGAAAAGVLADAARLPATAAIRAGALIVGTAGLLAAHALASFLDGETDTAQLPAAYALAATGAAGSLYRRRSVTAWALLPPLVAMTALTAWWSAFGLSPGWWGLFIAGAAFGYLAVAELDAPGRARRWRWAAAAPALLSLLVLHGADGSGPPRAAFPLTYALVLLAALTAYLRGRLAEALATLPALAAAFGGSVTWAALGHHPLWLAPWTAAAGLGYLALADRAPDRLLGGAPERDWWRAAAATAGTLALLIGHGGLEMRGAPEWHLPLAYALLAAGAAWETWRGRAVGVAVLPVLAALLGVSVLAALDVGRVWWSYPGLAAVAVTLLAEPWWRRRPRLAALGWQELLLGAAAVPFTFLPLYGERPAHGVAGFGIAALVYLAAALRARGALARMLGDPPSERARLVERQMLARMSGALLYAAAGYLNAALDLTGSDRAWVFAGIGVAAWLGLALFGGRRQELFGVLAPAAGAALALAAWIARDDAGAATPIALAGGVGPALAFPTTRRWSLWPASAGFLVAALAFGWKWWALDWATLPVVYGALAGVLFVALARLRTYERDERGATVTLLTWGSWLVALTAAVIVLGERQESLPSGRPLVRTREWAVLALVTAMASAAQTAEGVRLRAGGLVAAGSVGLLVALLLAIATVEPGNVQAYTLPTGLYLIGLGLIWRRSGEVLGRHLLAHEAVQVVGMLTLLLPAAEQSFEPDGGRFGLELIGAGLLLLAAGLAIYARWLAVGGVLTLTAVAVRWLLAESEVPYWLTLGLVGMALLGFGVLLLLERDRWDRARERVRRWWAGGTPQPGA